MLPFRYSHLLPGALSNVHVSGGNPSGTSSGDNQYSVHTQPSSSSAQSSLSNTFSHIPQANKESQPEWQGVGLTAPEEFPVLHHIIPKRGPIKGGDELYLIVDNLPPAAIVYARFGYNIVPTVSGPGPAERNERTDTSSPVPY